MRYAEYRISFGIQNDIQISKQTWMNLAEQNQNLTEVSINLTTFVLTFCLKGGLIMMYRK